MSTYLLRNATVEMPASEKARLLDLLSAQLALNGGLLDRLTHHAEIAMIEGRSFRVRESEQEAAARRKPRQSGAKTESRK